MNNTNSRFQSGGKNLNPRIRQSMKDILNWSSREGNFLRDLNVPEELLQVLFPMTYRLSAQCV